MPDDWRNNALAALTDARQEIEGATEKTLMVIITVSLPDLLAERPVSFYGNITPASLGPMLSYCGTRLQAILTGGKG